MQASSRVSARRRRLLALSVALSLGSPFGDSIARAAPPDPASPDPVVPAPVIPEPAASPEPDAEPPLGPQPVEPIQLGDREPPQPTPPLLGAASNSQANLLRSDDPVRALFEMPPAKRDDAYGPRPAGVPALSREQIVRYALDNPYVRAADQHIEAMHALLLMARFAWVPIIKTSAVLTPGAAIECDDVALQGENGPFSYQYCRAASDPANGAGTPTDLQTVNGYFARIADAGVAVRLNAEFVVPITTFGKIVNYKRLAKVGVEIAEIQKLAAEQETILRIYEAHAAVLLTRETIEILGEAWKILQSERAKIETGLGLGPDGLPAFDADPATLDINRDPDDLTRLELGEIELASRMREARMIESKALAALWAIAGNAAPQGFDVAEQSLEPDSIPGGLAELSHYRSLALKNRPEARLADGGVKARKVQEKIARTNFLPDLGAVVRLGYGYANAASPEMSTLYYTGRLNFSNIYFGLAFSWDLDFHNDAFALKKARAERREAEFKREAAQRMLLLEVEESYRSVIDAEQQLRFAEIARDKAWKLVISEQTAESIGASEFDDLSKALKQWAEFEFQRFQAVMNRNTAIARLSRSVGAPLTAP